MTQVSSMKTYGLAAAGWGLGSRGGGGKKNKNKNKVAAETFIPGRLISQGQSVSQSVSTMLSHQLPRTHNRS